MWAKISSALKPREGNDSGPDHSDAQSTARHPPPDPFRVNATTYYTHQTPPTPPPRVHSRTASREEDIIWSLRTQLALQQELCAQFEIDLGARDELVEALTSRLEASEKENDKRKNVVRSWKKKAADLEKMCRHLEEEVDNSRQESMERSIMDEASGEALRQLHRQISQLEREKSDIEVVRNSLVQTVDNTEAEIIRLREKLGNTDEDGGEATRQLHHRVSQLEREKSDIEEERKKADAETLKLREELDATDKTKREALHRLRDQISQLEREKGDIDVECNSLAQAKEKADFEVIKLKEELETSKETIREALCRLHDQISQLEREKNEVEAERNGLAHAMEKLAADVLKLKEELSVTNEANRGAQHRLHDQISQLERAKGDVETERDDLSSEIVRLRAHIQQLQKDSAVMEVTIVQLNKQLDQDKEDIGGLNIALESKQQELELVKRKHGARGTVGQISGRTNAAPSTAGKLVGNTVPPSTILRTSAIGTRTLSPVPPRVPSALGRVANTRPPVSSALRRASSSTLESRTKLSSRRLSVTSTPSEGDEKENASTPALLKHPRRMMIPA